MLNTSSSKVFIALIPIQDQEDLRTTDKKRITLSFHMPEGDSEGYYLFSVHGEGIVGWTGDWYDAQELIQGTRQLSLCDWKHLAQTGRWPAIKQRTGFLARLFG